MNQTENIMRVIEIYLEDELSGVDDELPPKIQQALTCIHRNLLDEKLTVSRIYQECCIKNHNFPAKFNYLLGYPPKQYISHHRLAIAKKLLSASKTEDISISTLAFVVGFSNVASFSRLFKRKTGISPSKWRKKNK